MGSDRSNRIGEFQFGRVLTWSTLAALLLAVLVVPFPFYGDQAMFNVYARMMSEGATLYLDIWDLKQPGIYFFYLVGGLWTSFDEIGIHIFEAIYWLVNAVMIARVLRAHLLHRWVAGLFPIFAPGLYFAVADIQDLTQVEALISPLLFWIVWLLLPRHSPSAGKPLTAGVLAGIIGVFKLIALLIPAVVLLTSIVLTLREGRGVALGARRLGWFVLGAFLPLGMLGLWILYQGTGEIVWFTWVELPPQVLNLAPRQLMTLVRGGGGFALGFAVPIVLALASLTRRPRGGDQLVTMLVFAIAACGMYLLLQYWWGYTFFVLVVPFSVLALTGIDHLVGSGVNHRRLWVLGAVFLALPALGSAAIRAVDFGSLLSGSSLSQYRMVFDHYANAQDDARVSPIGSGGDIYVLGTPTIFHILEADQSIPVTGWAPEILTEKLWRQVADDLAKPGTEAVFIADWASDTAARLAPWFEAEVGESYVEQVRSHGGRWLVPRAP